MLTKHHRTGGKEMIKMAQLEDIRKMYFMEDLSIREISRRTGIHRDTISKYISMEEPKPPKYKLTKKRNHPVLGPYIPLIKQIIEDDKTRPRKQRHTGCHSAPKQTKRSAIRTKALHIKKSRTV